MPQHGCVITRDRLPQADYVVKGSFWGAGKINFWKISEGLQLYFCKVISMHFFLFFLSVMDLPGTPGLGSSPPAL